LVKEPGQDWVVARDGYFTLKAASTFSLSKGKVDFAVQGEIVDLKVLRKGEEMVQEAEYAAPIAKKYLEGLTAQLEAFLKERIPKPFLRE